MAADNITSFNVDMLQELFEEVVQCQMFNNVQCELDAEHQESEIIHHVPSRILPLSPRLIVTSAKISTPQLHNYKWMIRCFALLPRSTTRPP